MGPAGAGPTRCLDALDKRADATGQTRGGQGGYVPTRLGARAACPFVTVNCGAISPQLIESELFGHVRGAFTGADRDRKGLLEEANGGTIAVDSLPGQGTSFVVSLPVLDTARVQVGA